MVIPTPGSLTRLTADLKKLFRPEHVQIFEEVPKKNFG